MTSGAVVDIGGTPFVHPFSHSQPLPASTLYGAPSHHRDRHAGLSVSSQGSGTSDSASTSSSATLVSMSISPPVTTSIDKKQQRTLHDTVISDDGDDEKEGANDELSPELSWMALYEAGRGYHSSLLAHTAAMWERERDNIERAKLQASSPTSYGTKSSRSPRGGRSKAGVSVRDDGAGIDARSKQAQQPAPDAQANGEQQHAAKRHRRSYILGLGGRSRRED